MESLVMVRHMDKTSSQLTIRDGSYPLVYALSAYKFKIHLWLKEHTWERILFTRSILLQLSTQLVLHGFGVKDGSNNLVLLTL